MAGYTCVRIAPIKSFAELKKVCTHNTRKEEERTSTHIDTERIRLNKVLVGTWDDDFVRMCKDEINASIYYTTHKIRKNAVYGFEVVIHYPGNSNDDQNKIERWAFLTKEWIQENFGKDVVKNMVLHMDEAMPHIHAVGIPMYENDKGERKLKYTEYVNGPVHLSVLQTSYATKVKELGFLRGVKSSPAKHQEMKKVYTVVHKAFSCEMPAIEVGETAEQYRIRVSDEWRELFAKTAILENEKIRDGDIRMVAIKKDEKINELRCELDSAQRVIIEQQEKILMYKKRDFLIKHGIEISRVDNMSRLINDLKDSLIEDAERDLAEKNLCIDEIVK